MTAALAKQGVPDPDAATQSAIAEGEVLVFQDALDEPAVPVQRGDDTSEEDTEAEERPVRVLIGLERYALAEESLADGLAKLINSVPKEDGSAADWEQAGAAKGSTGELIRAVAGHGLVLHTGGEASWRNRRHCSARRRGSGCVPGPPPTVRWGGTGSRRR